jgi:hypothetical protein
MAGFTIRCNDCGNEIITGNDYEAVNGKIDVELGRKYEDEEPYTFIFCWKCTNSTIFE